MHIYRLDQEDKPERQGIKMAERGWNRSNARGYKQVLLADFAGEHQCIYFKKRPK